MSVNKQFGTLRKLAETMFTYHVGCTPSENKIGEYINSFIHNHTRAAAINAEDQLFNIELQLGDLAFSVITEGEEIEARTSDDDEAYHEPEIVLADDNGNEVTIPRELRMFADHVYEEI